MRAALWLVALFGIAVAVALFVGNNHAVVTLFWPPHRVDVSFNLMVLALASFFVLLHFALRALAAVFSLPLQARRWRALQKERAMYGGLMDALAHLLAGRFIRASRSAENALLQERSLAQMALETGHDSGHNPGRSVQLRALAHLLAAESAQALQNKPLREHHLQQALERSTQRTAPEAVEGIQLRAARWALEDRDPHAALEWLNQLPQGASRRTLALRMKLRATQRAGLTAQALDTARLLAKHRAFSQPAGQSLVRSLALELLNAAHDPDQLQQAWLALDDSERTMPELAAHASSRLMTLHGDADMARRWLLPVWDAFVSTEPALPDSLRLKIVQALELGLDSVDAVWLARIEGALQVRPRDSLLQYLAGMACLKRQLWGKSQQLLTHAVLALQDSTLRRKAWLALAVLAEQRGDAVAAQQAFRQAAEF
jgi:HemY protein